MTTTDPRFEVPAQVMARQVGGETVILDLASGTYFGLDEVGARFWALAGQGLAMSQIAVELLSEYAVDADSLQVDLDRLAHELLERRLLVTRSPAP
jgi:Coenzyme PQQ synthesis protein D (PqqD)